VASLFISHSSSDRDAAQRLGERLRAEGFAALSLDFDPEEGIPAGRNWERELYAQLRKTDAVIFLASAASVASQWCFLEVGLARSLGKPIFPLRLNGDARLALLASASAGGYDKTVRLWDVASGNPHGEPLTGHTDRVNGIAFSPGGELLASAGWDERVRLWDVASGKPRGEPLIGHTDRVSGVEFNPDGELLASAGWDKTVRLWDVASGKLRVIIKS
jgi:WD40 repeat protein